MPLCPSAPFVSLLHVPPGLRHLESPHIYDKDGQRKQDMYSNTLMNERTTRCGYIRYMSHIGFYCREAVYQYFMIYTFKYSSGAP